MISGFYHLYSKHEDEPTLVYCYYSKDAGCQGVGFNTYNGGGFLPVADFASDTVAVPVSIVEAS